jgi:hypothetical protein
MHKYNTITLSDDLEQHHENTGTVAFFAIKNDSLYFEKYYDGYGSRLKE